MMSDNEDIVALILNYNSFELTKKCVANLLKIDKKLKILVVDNCSNDVSVEKLKKFLKLNERIHILENTTNSGYANGNNVGLKFIRDIWPNVKYVLILNPDIIVKEQKTIHALKSVLKNNEIYAIASCQIIFNQKWRGGIDFGWKFPNYKHMLWAGTFLGKFLLKDINNKYDSIIILDNVAQVDVVPGCFFMAKLDDLNKVNDFDKRTFLYFEETILAKKLAKINKKEVILLDEYISHNHQLKDKSLQNYKKKLFDRVCFYNSKMVYIKYFSDLKGVSLIFCNIINSMDLFMKKIIYGLASILDI